MGTGRFGGVVSSALGGVITSKHTAFVCYGLGFVSGALVALWPGRVETARRALTDAVVREDDERDR